MTDNNWDTIGENIRDIVQGAIDSKDFKELNKTVNSAIIIAAREMEKGLRSAADKMDPREEKTKQYQQNNYKQTYKPVLFANTTKTRILGIVFMAIGYSIGAMFALTFLLFVLGTLIIPDIASIILLVIFGNLTLLFMLFGYLGTNMFTRTRRFQSYIRGIGGRSYIEIEQLAYDTQKSVKVVRKDLEYMISKGWFVQGHLDHQKTTLMVTNEVYNEYLETLKRNEKKKQEEKHNGNISPELKEVLETGNEYITAIHKCNDAIPGEEISDKISRMESLVQKIFQRVEQHPENIKDIRKLMKYYLPTTIKLLEAYEELDHQAVQGENIVNSKKEIEKTLDTLNLAFEKLLDDMFQETAWDVSSDISVLETMLAQEGLTKKNFE